MDRSWRRTIITIRLRMVREVTGCSSFTIWVGRVALIIENTSPTRERVVRPRIAQHIRLFSAKDSDVARICHSLALLRFGLVFSTFNEVFMSLQVEAGWRCKGLRLEATTTMGNQLSDF